MTKSFQIRDIRKQEYDSLGKLMISIYSNLDGFPNQDKQPRYYEMLANISGFSQKQGVKVLVAVTVDEEIIGGVVYFDDMAQYGSGGRATLLKNASGFRLLGVSLNARGLGVGKSLSNACIQLAKRNNHEQLIIHTTDSMQTAWRMYKRQGFEPVKELDFDQEGLSVYGFRLYLKKKTD